jgi:hypothetical protein
VKKLVTILLVAVALFGIHSTSCATAWLYFDEELIKSVNSKCSIMDLVIRIQQKVLLPILAQLEIGR